MPETKRSTHRRGICEDESSHGVIMEKFIKDVSRNSKSARAREASDRPQRFSRRPDNDWRDISFNKRESVIQERGYGGHAFGGGGIHFHSSLISRRRVLERKRRYHFDSEAKGSAHEQKSYARKRAFECGEMRKALSMGNLSAPSFTESHPVDFASMPYVCDECGRCFSVISEFVEHQIMHTRENLYEYGESFIHSVAVSEVQKRQSGGKRFECKECGETFNKSAALAEHRKNHTRQQQAEPKDDEYEEPFMPSPTFSELQKMYGKDKFYECKVCKETFLHSSALIEHQKTHGRGNFPEDKDRERGGESFKPSPSLSNLQKMYGKDKLYECKICGETFHHSSSLKEHQKIHARGKPFENKPRVCEATYIPGQKRHQKTTYPKEKLCDFDDGPGAFMPLSDVKIHSRKNLYEARGYEKSVIHSMPYTESQKSHTITRPPEDEEEEEEKAFTISSNPEEKQKLPIKGNAYHWKPYEMSVIHSLAFAEAQKSHSAARPIRPRVIAESTIVQSSGSFEHQRVRGGDNASEGRKYERSVIHSLATFKRPRSRSGYEFTNHSERGESSVYISDLTEKPPKILVREYPYEVGKSNSYKGSVIHSVSHTKPQKNLTGEGSSDFLKDGEATLPSSTVREHQKARAKKKNIEGRNYETSVIHSLHFGEPRAVRPREKFYECQVCGESFIRNSDLTEHQKIHEQKKPSGSKNYERSVIRSLASTDPQPSYTEPRAQTSYAEEPPHSSYIKPAAHTSYTEPPAQNSCAEPPTEPPVQTSYALEQMEVSYAEPQAQTDQDEHQEGNEYKEGGRGVAIAQEHGTQQKMDTEEKPQAQKPFGGDSVIQSTGRDGPQLAQPQQEQPQQEQPQQEQPQQEQPQQEQPQQEKPEDDEDEDDDEDEEDSIYGCKDCGLGFADKADLKDHQKVHGRDYLVDTREYKPSVIHSPPVSEYQRDFNGEQLFECPACGESFVHSSFLFEHQKIHEQDQYYGVRRYEEPFMQPLIVAPRRPRRPQKNSPPGLFLQCQVCGEDFIHASVLNDHMRVHVGQNFAEPAEGETSEQAMSSSLALTEYQRSQAEERQYECRTCGAAFLSQSDLTEHMRIHEHDDQPYDYGASFVHTSFLTEPPKRDSPFYECKDCGKSFIHNTVLTKHQKLHVEEEEDAAAAATQEVEANVLVPREVLRIQGSNVEAAEPEVEAAEPEVEAAEPEVEAAEPNGEAEGPEGEAAEPNGEAEQPNDEAEQPAGDADEPDGAGIEDPEERAEEPEGDADEPDGVGIEDPEEEGEEQEAPGEAPFCRLGDCGETCASGQHLKAHARVIIFEPGPRASTSGDHSDDKYFKCDVCGQLFSDRLALARHQNSHTG